MGRFRFWIFLGLVLLPASGCVHTTAPRQTEVYPYSYDRTYMTVLSAVDHLKHWKLTGTDYGRGLVEVERGGYLSPKMTRQIFVKKVLPFQTKVEVKNSLYFSGRKLFEAIDQEIESRSEAAGHVLPVNGVE